MNLCVRVTGPVLLLAVFAGPSSATDPKEIDAAVKKGAEFLQQRYKNALPGGGNADEGVGPAALAGLALLETGTPATDPAVKAITTAVRDAAYSETRTYQIALCLLFLDRLGDRADGPVVQMLAVRLLAGQNAAGGWTYACIDSVPAAEEQRLRARLGGNQLVAGDRGPGAAGRNPEPPAGKAAPSTPGATGRLHPEVEKYRQGLLANNRRRANLFDDNSNTQFGVLAVWVARKHGVPVEDALDRIEKRFLATQNATGGWPYSGTGLDGSPSMTCAGLLGLATAVGRREERRLKAEGVKKPDPPKTPARPDPQPEPVPGDPFFNPPPRPAEPAPAAKKPAAPAKHAPAKHAPEARDKAVERALDNLAAALRGEGAGRGRNAVRGFGGLGDRDMYFYWSLERVGVVYGLEKIGRVDWYQSGADALLPAQSRDGSWDGGNYGTEVNTAFALLFLARSNLVRDLSAKVQGDPAGAELRAGSAPPQPAAPAVPRPKTAGATPAEVPPPVADESAKLAAELVDMPAAEWTKALERVRDAKGRDYTNALVLAIHRLDGDRKKEARHALAERLTRMSADTLRGMTGAEDAELRRGAVLACAMKDDRDHVPDLIDRLADDEETVVRAARAGLKSLSGGQDFGPAAGATKDDRKIAADAWRAWWARQK